MWTSDNEVVSQMIEEGLKKRKAEEDRARPIGTYQHRVTRWPEGIWEGSYEDAVDAVIRSLQFKNATVETYRWNGKEWEQVW